MEAAVIIPRREQGHRGAPITIQRKPASQAQGRMEEQDRNPIQDRRCLPIMSGHDEVDAIPLHPIITMP